MLGDRYRKFLADDLSKEKYLSLPGDIAKVRLFELLDKEWKNISLFLFIFVPIGIILLMLYIPSLGHSWKWLEKLSTWLDKIIDRNN